jgi:pimeloyl-ACP methyl ester carboxylesterase
MEFSAESKDRFVHEPSGTRIAFVRDDQGKVTELVLYRGGEHRAKRISEVPSSDLPRTVEVNGTTFQTVISGDGKVPVVLLSGLENWARVAAGIQKEARVVRYQADGAPADKNAPSDVRTQARVLHELLHTLEIAHPCILVGHSYNGALARIYASLYPDDVAGLVLVDPLDDEFVGWLRTNQPKNYELLRQRASENYVADWEDFLGRLRSARVPSGIRVVLLTAGHRQIREDDTLEKKITASDFEAGAMAVTKAHQAFIAKLTNGRQVVVPNAGHEIPNEQPEYVVQAVQQELAAISSRAK